MELIANAINDKMYNPSQEELDKFDKLEKLCDEFGTVEKIDISKLQTAVEEVNEDELTDIQIVEKNNLILEELKKLTTYDQDKISDMLRFSSVPPPIKHDWVVTHPSEKHGIGLFASKKIEKHKIVTFVPMHAICDKNDSDDKGNKRHFFVNNKHFPLDSEYMIIIDDRFVMFSNKENISKKEMIGHMINDSVSFSVSDKLEINDQKNQIRNAIARYYLQSCNNVMIKFIDDSRLAAIISTRDIEPGEEILMSYTPTFWLTSQQLIIYDELMMTDAKFNNFVLEKGKEINDVYSDIK